MRRSRTGRRLNVNLRALDTWTVVVEKSSCRHGEVRSFFSRPRSLLSGSDE